MQVSSTNLSQIAYPSATQASRTPQNNSSEEASETAGQKVAESAGQGDTVKLSVRMQAKVLKREGYSISQIASQLGMDAKTVNSYLNPQGSGSPKTYTPSSVKSEQGPAQASEQTPAASAAPGMTLSSTGKSNSK
jgi:hypothetical protein